MNAKELIEAAKELLSSRDPACSHIWNAHRQCQWCHRDRRDIYVDDIARHILATVREDDDEPVTRDAMAFEPDWRCDQLIYGVSEYLHKNGFSIVCDNGVFRFRGNVLQTMRKVRLVAALGE